MHFQQPAKRKSPCSLASYKETGFSVLPNRGCNPSKTNLVRATLHRYNTGYQETAGRCFLV